jgi:hypothetical protein
MLALILNGSQVGMHIYHASLLSYRLHRPLARGSVQLCHQSEIW